MRFERIGLEEALKQTESAIGGTPNRHTIKYVLDYLPLPKRGTKKSAGYDFRSPFDIVAKKGDTIKVPLFVKVVDMPENVVLLIFNRSGLSLNKGLRIDNSVGIIDSDYDYGIMFQATATKDITIVQGDRICQGIFVPFLTVDDDDASGERSGGFGSTGR